MPVQMARLAALHSGARRSMDLSVPATLRYPPRAARWLLVRPVDAGSRTWRYAGYGQPAAVPVRVPSGQAPPGPSSPRRGRLPVAACPTLRRRAWILALLDALGRLGAVRAV